MSRSDGSLAGWPVTSSAIEYTIADLMALISTTAEVTDDDEYGGPP